MYHLFVVLHIVICLVLCVVVLLQSSKGGGLAGAFGGAGAPQQIFGTRGMTTLLHKVTIYCAVGFFVTSGVLFALTAQRNSAPRSIVQEAASQGTMTSDVTPPAPAADVALPPMPDAGLVGDEGTVDQQSDPNAGTEPTAATTDEGETDQ
ncbi:MAG: preprotein translocase subunit SecG [bacterium]